MGQLQLLHGKRRADGPSAAAFEIHMAKKDFEKDALPNMACPVCKTSGSLRAGDRVYYVSPLIYEVSCVSCEGKGRAGYFDLSETVTYVEMPLVQPAPRKP